MLCLGVESSIANVFFILLGTDFVPFKWETKKKIKFN